MDPLAGFKRRQSAKKRTACGSSSPATKRHNDAWFAEETARVRSSREWRDRTACGSHTPEDAAKAALESTSDACVVGPDSVVKRLADAEILRRFNAIQADAAATVAWEARPTRTDDTAKVKSVDTAHKTRARKEVDPSLKITGRQRTFEDFLDMGIL